MIRIRNIPSSSSGTQRPNSVDINQKTSVRVYTGDVATSADPVILEALLGSCVAVCLYEPQLRVAGMNHILLSSCCLDTQSTRCGVHAMELLINELMRHGADRRRLIAKAFGGANVLKGLVRATIGDDNTRFVQEFLATERIPLVAQRLGGTQAVHLRFNTDNAKTIVRTVDGSGLAKIVRAETSYQRAHSADNYIDGEVTLF